MQCPKCQHENPEDASFCNRCGHKIIDISDQSSKILPIDKKIAEIQICGRNKSDDSQIIFRNPDRRNARQAEFEVRTPQAGPLIQRRGFPAEITPAEDRKDALPSR